MQRIFLTLAIATGLSLASGATVLAADVARPVYKAPPPAPVAPYSWTGFYVGIHGGGAWSDWDWFYPCTATNLLIPLPCNLAQGGHSARSWLAGGHSRNSTTKSGNGSGASRQSSAQHNSMETIWIARSLPKNVLHSRTDFIGTVASRLGLAWDRMLLYAKGGAAWVHNDYWVSVATGSPVYRLDNCDSGRNAVGLDGRLRSLSTPLRKIGPPRSSTIIWIFGTGRILFTSSGAIPGQLSMGRGRRGSQAKDRIVQCRG